VIKPRVQAQRDRARGGHGLKSDQYTLDYVAWGVMPRGKAWWHRMRRREISMSKVKMNKTSRPRGGGARDTKGVTNA
jgi:hypothetical protein